jgi:hypothetical protein
LTLVDGFQIRFQFHDNFHFDPANLAGSDGYVIDNVALSCHCVLELTNESVTSTEVHESPCRIHAGPTYSIKGTRDLTLSSPQGVVLRNGFSVYPGGSFRAGNDPAP